MAVKRVARRPRSDYSRELRSEEEEEEVESGESKQVKNPPPGSQEKDEAGGSGDASDPLADDTADAGHDRRPASPKRGKKRSLPPQQKEERLEKRAAGPDGETVAVSAAQRKKKGKRSADEDRRKNKKSKQIRKALTKPTSGIAQEDNNSPQQDEHRAHEEEQQKEVVDQEPADGSSPAKDNHSVDEEEQQEQPNGTSHPQEKNQVQEDDETGAQVNGKAFQVRNAPSTKPPSSKTEKKPAVERSWSHDDELKILNALVAHAQSNKGALPDSAHLLANLTFDKIDANEDKLTDKIRKLRTRYRRSLEQGWTSEDQVFKLSDILWGQDEQVEPISRDFSVLSELYPHLAKEVKAYTDTHPSGNLIMATFMTIGDEKARILDAKCKKQQIEAFKLELGQASLTYEWLSAIASLTHVKF